MIYQGLVPKDKWCFGVTSTKHTSVHLQRCRSSFKFPSKGLIIFFVSHSSEQVDAMQLMEHFKAHAVALLPSLRVIHFQGGFWHIEFAELGRRDPLVTRCYDIRTNSLTT